MLNLSFWILVEENICNNKIIVKWEISVVKLDYFIIVFELYSYLIIDNDYFNFKLL